MVVSGLRWAVHKLLGAVILVVISNVLTFDTNLSLVFQNERWRLAVRKVQIAIVMPFLCGRLILIRGVPVMMLRTFHLLFHIIYPHLLYCLPNIVFFIFALLDYCLIFQPC